MADRKSPSSLEGCSANTEQNKLPNTEQNELPNTEQNKLPNTEQNKLPDNERQRINLHQVFDDTWSKLKDMSAEDIAERYPWLSKA